MSVPMGSLEHSFDTEEVLMTQAAVAAPVTGLTDIDDVDLVEELSMLTTQTARMRARMADIMAELDRRRNGSTGSPAMSSQAAKSW